MFFRKQINDKAQGGLGTAVGSPETPPNASQRGARIMEKGSEALKKGFRALKKGFGAVKKAFRGFRFHIPGITKLDWYIIRQFLVTYVFLIIIIITIALIIDYNENIDKLAKAHVSFKKVATEYYANFIPYYINLFSPLFVFVAVIFFTTKLAGNSEIIAMKAAGVSFRRLLRPYFISAALIASLSFWLGGYIIPKGNVARVNFDNRYIKKRDVSFADNIQLQVDTGVVCFITHFDNRTKSGYGMSLDKFNGKKIQSRLTAQTISYDTLSDQRYKWTLQMYQIRTQKGMTEEVKEGSRMDTIIQMEPRDFFYVRNQQETMTLPELDDFIDRQSLRGAAGISVFEVEYYKLFATPFTAFILTLIGVTLSCNKRKGGMGASIGLGLALSFAYILLQTVTASFAVNAGWPPTLSVWIPNILFGLIALVLYWRTPK